MPIESDFLRRIAENPDDATGILVYADWLEEQGRQKESDSLRGERKYGVIEDVIDLSCPERIRDGDWKEVFAYAGVERGAEGKQPPSRALPNDDVSVEPFGRFDVKRIIAAVDGENDGDNWICVGELHDGRFFVVSAGCDYTGWG